MDTSMPASGTVWQLPSTKPVLKQQMKCSLSLPLVPLVVTTSYVPTIPSIPKNTPVSQVSHAPNLAMHPPPSVSVSWNQHQSLASPSPSQVVRGHLPGALASDQHNVPSHPHTDTGCPSHRYFHSSIVPLLYLFNCDCRPF